MTEWIAANARRVARAVGWASIAFGVLLFALPGLSAEIFGMGDQVALMRYLGARDLFIGAAILLGRRLALWMLARAIADAADVAIVIGMLVTGTPHPERAIVGLFIAGGFCCLDGYLAHRLRRERNAGGRSAPAAAEGPIAAATEGEAPPAPGSRARARVGP